MNTYSGLNKLKKILTLEVSREDKDKKEAIFKKLVERYKNYSDPWGFDIRSVKKALDFFYPFYINYFKVRVFGAEKIKDETYMVVSNHTGQVPIDGALITIAFALESAYPRMLHSMVERFMAALPFLGEMSTSTGQVLGDRDNCNWLLKNNESILVFPEGVRGISKSTEDYYNLQHFSQGFYRLAAENKTKILPVAVVGAEEMFPFVKQAKGLAKKLNVPSFPLSLNYVPLPTPIDIYFGDPIEIPNSLKRESTDDLIAPKIEAIEKSITSMIETGLQNKRESFLDKAKRKAAAINKVFL